MINSVQISPSFQKRIVAKVDLPSQNGVENCTIYELDEGKKDARKLKRQVKKQGYRFQDQFIGHLKAKEDSLSKMLNIKIFSLEDEKKNCLGLLKTYNFGPSLENIDYIEVNPSYQSSKQDTKVKNIGSALVTYFMKTNKDSSFIVLHPIRPAYGFYSKMGFERRKSVDDDKYFLTQDKVAQAIKNSEQRIGSKVEVLG